MAKTFSKCSLCGASKFLNSINLCKRCAKSPESAKIRGKALKSKAADLAAQEKYDEAHPVEAAPEATEAVETTESAQATTDNDAKKE